MKGVLMNRINQAKKNGEMRGLKEVMKKSIESRR